MKELVLYLVTTCEHRISIIEELITGALDSMAAADTSLTEVAGERTRLENNLQSLLAKKCSLRRKDFNALMKGTAARYERNLRALETDRVRLSEGLRSYLDELKQSVCCLRRQFIDFVYKNGDTVGLEATMKRIESAYRRSGQQAFVSLRSFQLRLESFRAEQKGMNQKLQAMVDMGDALRTEGLRQLQAFGPEQSQRVGRNTRKETAEKLCPVAAGSNIGTGAGGNKHHFIEGGVA